MGLIDPILTTGTLYRPGILVEAARVAAGLYRRERDLAPALGRPAGGLGTGAILAKLREDERAEEEKRRTREPTYRPGRHIAVLAALLAEAARQTNASASEPLRRAM